MNRNITLLSLLGAASLAAAGYFYTQNSSFSLADTDSNDSPLTMPQQIGQYLPAFVIDYLPDSFALPENAGQSNATIVQSASEAMQDASPSVGEDALSMEEPMDEQMTAARDSAGDEEQQAVSLTVASQTDNDDRLATPTQSMQQDASVARALDANELTDNELLDQNLDQGMVAEVEQSLEPYLDSRDSAVQQEDKLSKRDDSLQPVQIDTAKSDVDEASRQKVNEMKQKLASIKAELSTLDSENRNLESRFQDVLLQNKSMAQKLEEIDEQIQSHLKQ